MAEHRVIHKGFRLALVFMAAALATFILFVIMLALIATSFERRKEHPKEIKFVALDAKLTVPEVKAKLLTKDIASLLNPIDLPPSLNTKAALQPRKPQTMPIVTVIGSAEAVFNTRPNISTFMPASMPVTRAQKVTASSANSGSNECTLIAHIGPSEVEIASIEILNCLHGQMADAAEIALYKWVNSGAESYTNLGAQVGDAVEFTYKEKRKTASTG